MMDAKLSKHVGWYFKIGSQMKYISDDTSVCSHVFQCFVLHELDENLENLVEPEWQMISLFDIAWVRVNGYASRSGVQEA